MWLQCEQNNGDSFPAEPQWCSTQRTDAIDFMTHVLVRVFLLYVILYITFCPVIYVILNVFFCHIAPLVTTYELFFNILHSIQWVTLCCAFLYPFMILVIFILYWGWVDQSIWCRFNDTTNKNRYTELLVMAFKWHYEKSGLIFHWVKYKPVKRKDRIAL